MIRMYRVILNAFFIVSTVVAGAREPSRSDDALILTLHLDKDEYVYGEPFTATIVLRPATWPAIAQSGPSFETGLVLLYRHENEREFRPYSESTFDIWSAGQGITLPPEGLRLDLFLVHDSNRSRYPGTDAKENLSLFFIAPGTYLLKAQIRSFRRIIESNLVAVRIRAPEGENAEAWTLWKDSEVTSIVQNRGFYEDEQRRLGLEKLRELVVKFPDTIYANYARARLAKERPPITEPEPAEVLRDPTPLAPKSAEPTPPQELAASATWPFAVAAALLIAIGLIWWMRRRRD